jgi:membrane protein
MAHYYKSKHDKVTNPSDSHESIDSKNPVLTDVETSHSHPLIEYFKTKTLKGLNGHSIYEVGKYFFRSMFMENLNIRASSLSFNFFTALFPALIFLLTLIAYLPIKGIKTQFINQLAVILPTKTFQEISTTILEILHKQNSSLLSFGFILTIYFASNSFHLMINTFNRRVAIPQKKSWLHIRGKAVFLTFWMCILIIAFLLLVTWTFQIESYMVKHKWPLLSVTGILVKIFEYALIIALFLFAISSIYYFAPSNEQRWRFFSVGSIFTTILSLVSTFGFSLYVNNFDSYNKVYGSIGAILALMVLIYINILIILIGFELNASIDKAEISKQRKLNKNSITQ